MGKFISSFKLIVAALGCIGGLGYACYNQAWVIAAAVVLLSWLAWPAIKEAFKDLNS